MEQLVVRLGSNATDRVHWLVWSSQEEEIIASGELEDASFLDSLSERAGQRPITALVPGSDLFLKWVELPKKAGRKAIAAVPYMLEDELSVDISEQFFAMGDHVDDRQAVAVVSRVKMHQWLDWIAQAGLLCSKMVPDVLALPIQQDNWSMLALGEQLIVRQNSWEGIQGDQSWIIPAIEHFAKKQEAPLDIADYSGLELPSLSNTEIHQQPLDVPMQVLAQGAKNCKFNLLQGDFKPKRQSTGQLGQWKWAAVLAGVALLVTLVDKGVQLNSLHAQRDALNEQIEQEYKRAFPESTRIVNVRSQMRQKMASLEQGGGGVSMLAIMTQLSGAFSASQVKPQTLKYDSKRSELRLLAMADSFEALEQFKRLAEELGYEVQQGAINKKDDQVIGSLSIRS